MKSDEARIYKKQVNNLIASITHGLQARNDRKYRTDLIWLNKVNGANVILARFAEAVAKRFKNPVFVEMGSCYGGGVEWLGRHFQPVGGKAYGFDTFVGHPKHLGSGPDESDCMDYWYNNPEYGREKLDYDYQSTYFKDAGMDNVTLVKGLIHRNSCKDIPKIHLAFLDLDILTSMKKAYYAVKNKIVKGGYLLFHDANSTTYLVNNYKFVKDVVMADKKKWKYIGDWQKEIVIGFERL